MDAKYIPAQRNNTQLCNPAPYTSIYPVRMPSDAPGTSLDTPAPQGEETYTPTPVMNRTPPVKPQSPLRNLNIRDARIRKRVRNLLIYIHGKENFNWQEIRNVCGCSSNPNSKMLMSIFIELPHFPSKKLGEGKMYAAIPTMVTELREMLEEGED